MTKVNTVVPLGKIGKRNVHAHFSGKWGWCIRWKTKSGKAYWLCGDKPVWADPRDLIRNYYQKSDPSYERKLRRTYDTLEELKMDFAMLKLQEKEPISIHSFGHRWG